MGGRCGPYWQRTWQAEPGDDEDKASGKEEPEPGAPYWGWPAGCDAAFGRNSCHRPDGRIWGAKEAAGLAGEEAMADGAGEEAAGEAGKAFSKAGGAALPDGIFADFCQQVFGQPADTVTPDQLQKIRQMELRSAIDYYEIRYSMEDPMTNPFPFPLTSVTPRERRGSRNKINFCHSITHITSRLARGV